MDSHGENHGMHATVVGKQTDGRLRVAFDDETESEFGAEYLRPVPDVGQELTDREHDTVTNIWGEGVSSDLQEESTEKLWEMEKEVSDAVQLSYEDDDIEAVGILLPLELKITQVLSERMGGT